MLHEFVQYQAERLQKMSVKEIKTKIQQLQHDIDILREKQLNIGLQDRQRAERIRITDKVIDAREATGDPKNKGSANIASASSGIAEISNIATAINMPLSASASSIAANVSMTSKFNVTDTSTSSRDIHDAYIITNRHTTNDQLTSTAVNKPLITNRITNIMPITSTIALETPTVSTAAVLNLVNKTTKSSSKSKEINIPATYKLKMPTYKTGDDIEIFIYRYEHFCKAQNIANDQKAIFLQNALDEITFTIIIRELTENERSNYLKLKEHLLQRFDTMLGNKRQTRLLLRQARRKSDQDIQEFYTDLMNLAAKAYPGPHNAEQAQLIDEIIMDQLIFGCEDEKIRLFLLERNSTSSRDALSYAMNYKSAIQYNESIKSITATACSLVQPVTSRSTTENTDINKPASEDNVAHKILNDHQKGHYLCHNRNIGLQNKNMPSSHFKDWRPHTFKNYNSCNWQIKRAHKYRPKAQNNISRNSKHYTIQPEQNKIAHNYIRKYGNINVKQEFGSNHNQKEQSVAIPKHNENNHHYISPQRNYFLAGKVGQNEILMLCDKESEITLIDENLWESTEDESSSLENVDYSINSLTKHNTEIVGKTHLNLKLKTRRGKWHQFKFPVSVAKGLSTPVILGTDFFQKQNAIINEYNNCVYMYEKHVNTVYKIINNNNYNTRDEVNKNYAGNTRPKLTDIIASQNEPNKATQSKHQNSLKQTKKTKKENTFKIIAKMPLITNQNKNRPNVRLSNIKDISDSMSEAPITCHNSAIESKESKINEIRYTTEETKTEINITLTEKPQEKSREIMKENVTNESTRNNEQQVQNKEIEEKNDRNNSISYKSLNGTKHVVKNDNTTTFVKDMVKTASQEQNQIIAFGWKLCIVICLILLRLSCSLFTDVTLNSTSSINYHISNWRETQRLSATEGNNVSHILTSIIMTIIQTMCAYYIIFHSSIMRNLAYNILPVKHFN